jgi:hypothetical protein
VHQFQNPDRGNPWTRALAITVANWQTTLRVCVLIVLIAMVGLMWR